MNIRSTYFSLLLCVAMISGTASAQEDPLDFWSFQAVQTVTVPTVSDPAWAENPIDAFILHGLEAAGLSPVAPASKATLIRRAYYDITGLPPTSEAVHAFVADESPEAYARVLDTLLASPQYGEKWARHWLDLVRYADSNGYERDSDKPFIWRYRDYVIDAFNADMPYDQFIREQLAGDEMDASTPEQMTATGYYRLGLWDDEPADPALSKFNDLDDLVKTTSEVFLGLSIGCARCHDHKIDPILQTDYYQFLSFFHNIQPLTRTANFGILRSIMNPEEQAEYTRQVAEKNTQEAQAVTELVELLENFKAKATMAHPDWFQGDDARISDITQLTYRFYRDTWDTLPDFDMIKVEDTGPIAHNYLTVSPASRQSAIGFVFEGQLRVPEDGKYTFFLSSKDGARLSVANLSAVESKNLGDTNLSGVLQLKQGLHPFRVEYFTKDGPPRLDLSWEGPNLPRRSLSIAQRQKAPNLDALIARFKEHGATILGAEQAERLPALQADIDRIRKTVIPSKQAPAVSEKGPQAPDTFLLTRGNPHAPAQKVEPGFPLLLSPPEPVIPEAAPEQHTSYRRTALANWIASPENPMTARVMANRLWQHHFGRGIVRSTNNLGLQGDTPTHPELLDWLATELIQGDWKLKALHKKIMLSRSYQLASHAEEKGLAQDPENNLFWRFNMRRLTAEEVRDSMLHASGALNLKAHGPTIYPKLSPEVLATSSKVADIVGTGTWGVSTPEEANRRSIYIHLKRSLKHPMLSTFDLADIDTSCPVRFTTTQPAQALNLLNSAFAHEQAQALKQRVQAEHPKDLDAQLVRAFEHCAGRLPTSHERDMSHSFVRSMQEQEKLSLDRALEHYCLLALNLNEFLYLD